MATLSAALLQNPLRLQKFEAEQHRLVGLGLGEVAVAAAGNDVLPVRNARRVECLLQLRVLRRINRRIMVSVDNEGGRQAVPI